MNKFLKDNFDFDLSDAIETVKQNTLTHGVAMLAGIFLGRTIIGTLMLFAIIGYVIYFVAKQYNSAKSKKDANNS